MREVINHSTYTHLLNIIKSIQTQTLEKLYKKRVHGKKDFDKLYFRNALKKLITTSQCEIKIDDSIQIIRSMCIKREKKQYMKRQVKECNNNLNIYINKNTRFAITM